MHTPPNPSNNPMTALQDIGLVLKDQALTIQKGKWQQ